MECFIAEQNMVGVAQGFAVRGRIPWCSTFATFFTRAFDQIRIAGLSKLNVKFAGSHVGVSIGADGPTQMALEDLALFRSIPGSVVFYPSCANSALRAMELSANRHGIDFVRTNRPKYPVIYSPEEVFSIGKCKVLHQSDKDQLCIIAGGVPFNEALGAVQILKGEGIGINVRLIDLFTVKPIDPAIAEHIKASNGLALVVEEHYECGGIFDAVCASLSLETGIKVHQVAVTTVPRSGPARELLDMYNLSAEKIAEKVQQLLAQK